MAPLGELLGPRGPRATAHPTPPHGRRCRWRLKRGRGDDPDDAEATAAAAVSAAVRASVATAAVAAVAAASGRSWPSPPPRRHGFPRPPPFAADPGTAADAAPAAEPPPVAATVVTTVAPSTAAAIAAVAAAAERVGGAWEGGRAPWEGCGRGGSRRQFGSISDFDVVFWLVLRRLCVFISCVRNTVRVSRL